MPRYKGLAPSSWTSLRTLGPRAPQPSLAPLSRVLAPCSPGLGLRNRVLASQPRFHYTQARSRTPQQGLLPSRRSLAPCSPGLVHPSSGLTPNSQGIAPRSGTSRLAAEVSRLPAECPVPQPWARFPQPGLAPHSRAHSRVSRHAVEVLCLAITTQAHPA